MAPTESTSAATDAAAPPAAGAPGPDARAGASVAVRAAVLVAVLVGLGIAAVFVRLPPVSAIRTWIDGWGAVAPVAFVAILAALTLAPVPKSLLTVTAGAAFGVPYGLLLVVLGATGGAVLAFGIARGLGRDGFHRVTRGHTRLDRLDAAIERHGVLAALVVRLIPVLPFTVLNYACGVTAMRARHFVAGTAIGIVPGSAVLVTLGAAGAHFSPWLLPAVSVGLALGSLLAGAAWRGVRSGASRKVAEPGA